MLDDFACFCSRLLTFSDLFLNPDSFMKTIRVSNDFNPGQDPVDPDLGLNGLHK